ncbi:DUF4351 domain-containing protein [Castellaniella denitrificans]|uniref:DUF4351 domain-containing protein n=1 Tax=Castellaniella denitrificans TaxID=56119 RepID=UPI00361090EF
MSARNASSPAFADDHDSPWKDALELYFPQALALLTPNLYSLIDGSVPVEFLDKELQAVLRASAPGQGHRHADKLARVRLRSGDDALLLVHVEIQGRLSGPQALQVFGWRMLEYNVLIRQRERRRGRALLPPQVYSLGVLIDQPRRAPHEAPAASLTYRNDFLAQRTRFTFPIVELNDWRARWDELDALAPVNPFAVVIMAQLQAAGHPDKASRLAPLLDLTRRLYGYGYTRDGIGPLLRLVEWMLRLPADLETDYFLAAQRLEQEHEMSYVTIAERHGMIRGQADLLLRLIQRRFGPVDEAVVQRIRAAGTEELETWSLNVLDAASLEEVFKD